MAEETIASMRDAVLSLDHAGKIIMLNPAAAKLLHVRAEESIGRSFAEMFIFREDLETLNDCIIEAMYDPSTPHVSEICLPGVDDDVQHLVVRTNLLKSDTGDSNGVVAVIADISEQVRLLEERVEQKRMQNQFGHFFIYILSIYGIGTIVNYTLKIYSGSLDAYSTLFNLIYLLILIVPSLLTIRIMHVPISTLGLTLNNWKKSLVEGVVASVGLIAVGSLLVLILEHFSAVPSRRFTFSFAQVLLYYFHSFLQEMMARGIVQSSFEQFFDDQKGFKSVLLTSLFFGMLHIHFGMIAVCLAFVAGLFFGAFYQRHHNLIGVTVLHGTLGIFAFCSGLL
jgi:PAS domain S-box-containing protein